MQRTNAQTKTHPTNIIPLGNINRRNMAESGKRLANGKATREQKRQKVRLY